MINKFGTLSAVLVATMALAIGVAAADTVGPITFESPTYVTGTIHNQDGWSSFGAAGTGCAVYDHAVVTNAGAPASFGSQSLRISNAVTSGCFGDQTFSKSLTNEAGETSAINGGLSGGTRQNHFEAQWDFVSTVPGAEQVGLSVVASPDRGDGARMSWVQMADTPSGLAVNFYDYQDGAVEAAGSCATGDNFIFSTVAVGLTRSLSHTIKVTMDFLPGANNDVVRVYVDGVLRHTGTSWEGYFNYCESNPTRTVDSILFRTGGAPAPATAGKGFLIDNLRLTSAPLVGPPTDKDQCKKDGWMTFNSPSFPDQGTCVSYVNNHS